MPAAYRDLLEKIRLPFPQPVSDRVHDSYFVHSIMRALDQVDGMKWTQEDYSEVMKGLDLGTDVPARLARRFAGMLWVQATLRPPWVLDQWVRAGLSPSPTPVRSGRAPLVAMGSGAGVAQVQRAAEGPLSDPPCSRHQVSG